MLISKTLLIKPSSNALYYRNKGYVFENKNNLIEIKIEDLSSGSKIKVDVKCDICGSSKQLEWRRYLDNIKSLNIYACSSKCSQIKVKTNNLKKYGVENVSELPDIREKVKSTMVERYGVEHTFQSEELKEKSKQTIIERYGVENVRQSAIIDEKIKRTNLERYGVEQTFNSDIIKEKIQKTLIEKYGTEHFSKSQKVKDKIKQTNLSKYGVEYFLQTNEIDEIKRKSYKEKYGVEWISQSEKIKDGKKEKSKLTNETKTSLKYKNILNIDKYNILSYKDSTFNIEHVECGTNFNINVRLLNERLKYNSDIEICTICKPISSFSSSVEKTIQKFLDENNINYETSNRKVLNGKELDIYIPEYNLAIEFNGLYWHSELYKTDKYHLDKTIECENKGITLLHIFEDDWVYKNDIVKSIILNKLNLTPNRIYARKCEIKEVKPSDAIEFLNQNHIQGGCKSTYKIGLYYNDELVSVMTFGYRRTNAKKEFELIRYCNKINTSIIGASSKLFNYFLKHYKNRINETYLISYADISLFDGKLYKNLKFDFIHRSKPNYFWVVDGMRKHRFIYNKQNLIKEGFDSTKTEVQIMHERGYYRIWGCGQDRYVYNF